MDTQQVKEVSVVDIFEFEDSLRCVNKLRRAIDVEFMSWQKEGTDPADHKELYARLVDVLHDAAKGYFSALVHKYAK